MNQHQERGWVEDFDNSFGIVEPRDVATQERFYEFVSEVKDFISKVEDEAYERGLNESRICRKPVENGTAYCGCKLDCRLHDWRQKDFTDELLEKIAQEIENNKATIDQDSVSEDYSGGLEEGYANGFNVSSQLNAAIVRSFKNKGNV